MEKKRCCIQIDGTRYHTWQGVLHTVQGQIPFRSELELIKAMQQNLCGENETAEKERGTQSC